MRSGMTTISRPDMVRKCIENDRMAQHELFHLYKQKIHDLTYKSLGNRFDIDDVVQQVFIAVFGSLRHFKGESSLDTWVYRITVKVCTTQLRKKYRKRQPNIMYDSMEREREDPASGDPCSAIEQQELSRVIYDALDKLPVEKRMIVTMYEMDGFTLEEIAQIIKKPLGTVKSRLFHGRKALEKQLRGYVKP
jgi:RNA polymerase sigma-70 factor, ECF subfamily